MMKNVEIAIVLPVKHSVGKRVGTLMRRAPESMTLPEIIKQVRKDYKDDTEGVIFLDNNSFNQTLADFKARKGAHEGAKAKQADKQDAKQKQEEKRAKSAAKEETKEAA